MRECLVCKKNFAYPGDRHKTCGTCRNKSKKIPCSNCDNKMSLGAKICERCNHANGPKSRSWKGGRCFLKNGYVVVYEGKRKYRFEHILRVEEKLGRKLLKGENIHHKNGVRHDNRLKNLELWTSPQPSGIRVSDAVKWAKEILKRYK